MPKMLGKVSQMLSNQRMGRTMSQLDVGHVGLARTPFASWRRTRTRREPKE